jgi:hypothetical protein
VFLRTIEQAPTVRATSTFRPWSLSSRLALIAEEDGLCRGQRTQPSQCSAPVPQIHALDTSTTHLISHASHILLHSGTVLVSVHPAMRSLACTRTISGIAPAPSHTGTRHVVRGRSILDSFLRNMLIIPFVVVCLRVASEEVPVIVPSPHRCWHMRRSQSPSLPVKARLLEHTGGPPIPESVTPPLVAIRPLHSRMPR